MAVTNSTATGLPFRLLTMGCGGGSRLQGTAPTLAVDNTSGCQLYLGAASLHASVTTAKSSEVNVLVPGTTPEDDLVSLTTTPGHAALVGCAGSNCLKCQLMDKIWNVEHWQVEHALPEQFIHKYEGSSFVTQPVSHSGG